MTQRATDPQLGRFVIGLSTDSKTRICQPVVDFLCAPTGGSCMYTGRDMKTAHTSVNIGHADCNKSVQSLVDTLDTFKVLEKEKPDGLGALSSLKGDIAGH